MLLLVKKLTIKIAAIATAAVLVAGLIFGGAFKLGQYHQQTHPARLVKGLIIEVHQMHVKTFKESSKMQDIISEKICTLSVSELTQVYKELTQIQVAEPIPEMHPLYLFESLVNTVLSKNSNKTLKEFMALAEKNHWFNYDNEVQKTS